MACDIQGILNGSSALRAELSNYSDQEILTALYSLACDMLGSGADCSPATRAGDPCVACLSDSDKLTAIASLLCGNPDTPGNCALPTLSYAQPPNGIRGQSYSYQLTILRGTANKWEIVDGSLPIGLSLNSDTGLISGTVAGNAATDNIFLVRAGNNCGWDYEQLSIHVDDACFNPTVVLPGTEVRGTVGQFMRAQAGMTGSAPGTWSMTGTLPPGLIWDPVALPGIIEGTPTQAGEFSFNVTVTNPCGSDTKTVVVKIFNPEKGSLVILTKQLPGAVVNEPYQFRIRAHEEPFVDGIVPVLDGVDGGLPSGFSFDPATGIISGTALTPNAGIGFTIRARKFGYADVFQSYVFVVTSACVAPSPISIPQLFVTVNHDFIFQVGATGSAPITWTDESVELGVALSSAEGIVQGRALTEGVFTLVFRATNACGSETATVNIFAVP